MDKVHKPIFGTGEPRMVKWCLHPDLDLNGAYTRKYLGQDPQLYHPQDIKDIFEVNKNNPSCPWAKQDALQQWAANLGYRNQEILKARNAQRKKLGPAWHSVTEYVCPGSYCENVSFGVGRRFTKHIDEKLPPGIYTKEHPYKVPHGPHTKMPSFDWSDPCRFKDTVPRWFVAPNRYKIKDPGSVEGLASKVVSLRGPYDLFTPERNEYSIKNHFGVGARCQSASFPMALPGSLETLKKRRIGMMLETGMDKPPRSRFANTSLATAIRKPSDPGPNHYQRDLHKKFKQNMYGFLCCDPRPRNYVRQIVWPAVGRYSPENLKSCTGPIGHGHCYVFNSKIQREAGFSIPKPYNSF